MKLNSKALKLDSIWKKPEIVWEFNILPNTITSNNFKRIRINNDENISSLYSLRWEKVNLDTYITANYIIQEVEKIYMQKWEDFMHLSIMQASNEVIKKLKKSLNWWEKSLYKSIKIYELERRVYNLQKDSLTDSLTWLANRRMIEKELEKICDIKNREWTDSSILMIDIDYFKKINDKYWHNAWDKTLIEISKIFKSNLRTSDIIWRWWWEEFIIILPSTNIDEAICKANNLRKQIEENLTKNINIDEIDYNITASIWVSKINRWNKDWNKAINEADFALYLAKKSWRNKVVKEIEEKPQNCEEECNTCSEKNKCVFLLNENK